MCECPRYTVSILPVVFIVAYREGASYRVVVWETCPDTRTPIRCRPLKSRSEPVGLTRSSGRWLLSIVPADLPVVRTCRRPLSTL